MSDDDVPDLATATGHHRPDGDTTAALTSATDPSTEPWADEDDEQEDRTVQQTVDPQMQSSSSSNSVLGRIPPQASSVARPAPPAPPVRITSRKMTAVGLGAPPPATRAAAGYVPAAASPKDTALPPLTAPGTQAEAEDDSITATAPAPRAGAPSAGLPMTVPSSVKITEIGSEDDDPLDETEVRTLVGAALPNEPASRSPAPAAGTAPDDSGEADELDDSVTTQAPSPMTSGRLPEEDEPKTSPPMLAPAAGRRPSTPIEQPDGDEDDAYGAEESITTRGPAVQDYGDDSVTAQAPVTRQANPAALQAAPELDATDTTSKLAQRNELPRAPSVGAPDDEPASITSEAPAGHLSNMLQVIASQSTSPTEGGDDELDDSTENHTAVMANAPARPVGAAPSGTSRSARVPVPTTSPVGGSHGASMAELRTDLQESDSGLRVAHPEQPNVDHASLGAVMTGSAGQPEHVPDRGSSPALSNDPTNNGRREGANSFVSTEQAFAPPAARPPEPSLRDFDFASTIKKPRYGLIVGFVAVLSFAIPLLLFFWLQSNAVEAFPRERAELAPDPVGRGDPPRTKAVPSGKAAASGTRKGGGPSTPPRK